MGEEAVVKMGPDGFDKIAVVGSAPSSMLLAPWSDLSWAIWCCSPAVFSAAAQKRSDVWFESHRFLPSEPGKFGAPGTRTWFSPEFHLFLQQHKGPVFMSEVIPTIPNSVRIPFEKLVAKYGPYFFTSTLAFMVAMAIDTILEGRERREIPPNGGTIGLFGVDMAATEEYAYQRPGCQHFVGMAVALGINIALPPESDLMRPPMIYGLGELNPRHIKMNARLQELLQREAQAAQQLKSLEIELAYIRGAKADVEYVMQSWCDDVTPDITKAFSFADQFKTPVPAANATHPAQSSDRPSEGGGSESSGAEVTALKDKVA